MASEHSNKSKNKDKQKMTHDLDEQTKDTKREPNWTEAETTYLLHAVKHVHAKRGRVGFNFTPAERHDVFRFFKDSLPDTTRVKDKCENRLKVLLKMFKVCNELANRSGGGWDDEHHRPIAPSHLEYIEMVRTKGDAGRFLVTKNFPWYREMVDMVGGQSARGESLDASFVVEEPIDVMLSSQMAIHCSEQGSSDDPDEGKDDENDSVHNSGKQPARGGGPYARPGEASEDTGERTWNSASKRKSTDDSDDAPKSRGKRYKERAQKLKQEHEELAKAGLAIAKSIAEETIRKSKESVEIDMCIAKFDELNISPRRQDWAMGILRKDLMRRRWFLSRDREAIVEWIERNMMTA